MQDVKPESELGGIATAFWEKAGAHRVSYILPSAEWLVGKSKVVWPETGPLRKAAEKASRHRMNLDGRYAAIGVSCAPLGIGTNAQA